MNTSSNIVRAVGLAFLLIGSIVFVILFLAFRDLARTSDWASVPGVVLSSTVVRQVEYDDDEPDEIESILFSPRVTYRYTVNGVTREGRRVDAFVTASSDETWARQESARFPVGSTVRVYHSPDGTDAVLVPGIEPSTWAWLALPGLAILVGLALQFTGPRRPALKVQKA